MRNIFLSIDLINFVIKTFLNFKAMKFHFVVNLLLKSHFEFVHLVGKENVNNNGIHSEKPDRELKDPMMTSQSMILNSYSAYITFL